MNNKKNEKWLDELISRTIDSGKVEFDAEKWKQKYPEEFQLLKSRTRGSVSFSRVSLFRVVLQSRITKLAAAAAIIVAICLFFTHHGPNGQIETRGIAQTTDSPAKLTTFGTLSFAYRQGGMEMVEQMCDKALQMAGQRPANISLQEFLEAINNGKSERTEL